MQRQRVAVFASGSGSNFVALVQAQSGAYDIVLLVCDVPDAPVLARASACGIPSLVMRPRDYVDRPQYEQAILRVLQQENVAFIALAGYMRLLTPVLLGAFPQRILNVHPSLLPAFPGRNAIAQAIEYGVKYTGVTVHVVDEGMDTGPIIAQQVVDILPIDTPATLTSRVHAIEHTLYTTVLALFVQGKYVQHGRTITLESSQQ
jgi:phosphoribosylglycinamide formyltransferase-1